MSPESPESPLPGATTWRSSYNQVMSDAVHRAFQQRAEALRRFGRWQEQHPSVLDPRVAVEGVGWLWQLLPQESRERPLDTRGIQRMRRLLAVLR